ncbi:Bacterial regulatory protein, Fis family [compost metagenome]
MSVPTAVELDFSKGLNTLVAEFEAHAIRTCLKQTSDIEHAARVLQVSRSNLYKKIKDYQIEEETSS